MKVYKNNFAIIIPMANESKEFDFFTGKLQKTLDFVESGHVYLIVDNASKDDTHQLCEQLSEADHRFTTIWAPENKHVVDAYMRGYKEAGNNLKYGILMIAGFSLLHTSLWITTNKTDASIGWVEKAIETDPARYYKKSFNNEAMLAELFEANKLYNKSLKWYQLAYRKYPNDPRMGYNYVGSLLNRKQENEAIAVLEELVSKFPTYPLSYPLLAKLYIVNEDYKSLYNILIKMEAAYKIDKNQFDGRMQKESIDQLFDLLNQLKNNYNLINHE